MSHPCTCTCCYGNRKSSFVILYAGCYYIPHVIFAVLYLQTVFPRLEFAQAYLCLKRDNLEHCNLPTDNVGERGDYFPVYSRQSLLLNLHRLPLLHSPTSPITHSVMETSHPFILNSCLSPPKNPSRANFVAEYTAVNGCPILPIMKEIRCCLH